MELSEAMEYISYLFDKADEEKLYMRWIQSAQYEMSFEEFKIRLVKEPIRDDEDILEEVYDIIGRCSK